MEPAPDSTGAVDSDPSTLPRTEGLAAGYPLRIGNRWIYEGETRMTLLPSDGSLGPSTVIPWQSAREIVCTEDHSGTPYTVEQRSQVSGGAETVTWVRYRQDFNGLYELDVAISDPPVCLAAAPGRAVGAGRAAAPPDPVPAGLSAAQQRAYRDALTRLRDRVATIHALLRIAPSPGPALPAPNWARPGELMRLRYPLRFKLQWVLRPGPPFTIFERVEGYESFLLPAGKASGYRIRLFGPLIDQFGTIRMWYGNTGYLRMESRFEVEAVDQSGNLVGRVEIVERERLVAVQRASNRPVLP